jgi:hypothetical protein
VITPSLTRNWQLRFYLHNKERWLGLGPTHTVSLRDARERARAARQLLDGVDPIAAKKKTKTDAALAAAKALTFEEAALQYPSTRGQVGQRQTQRAIPLVVASLRLPQDRRPRRR